ncbi:MAG: hypothetical protein IT573_09935 [Deltaproteobacteria bacterium]|nr:hypothetical protein [Deltaproteobacteria bacterium]
MKRFLISFKAALLFATLLFGLQCLLFFYAPSFYLPSLRQLALPDFIVRDVAWRLAKIAGLYLAWAGCLGAVNAALVGWAASGPVGRSEKGRRAFAAFFFLAAAQTVFLFGWTAWQYPSVLGFFPMFWEQSLIVGFAQIFALGIVFLLLAFAMLRPRGLRSAAALGLAALLPTLLHAPLAGESALDLPPARAAATKQPRVLLLGFDALDGDSGNAALARAAAGLGGRIFRQAFTPLPATHPAWNSVLSGVYPERHGVRLFFDSPLPHGAEALTLPRRLRDRHGGHSLFASDQPETSYFTAEQGFSESVIPEIGWKAHLGAALLNHFVFPALWTNNAFVENLRGFSLNSPSLFNYDAPRFFNFSFRKFSRLPEGARLMALHTCHLHSPIRLARSELAGLEDWLRLRPKDFSFWRWSKPGDPLNRTPEGWHNPYFLRRPATLRLLEDLVAELRAKGYFASHRVAFLSDHGERFVAGHEIYGGIHGLDLKGREQNNVLFGIFDPRWTDLKEVETPASLVDLTPTLIALHGGKAEGYDGVALFDAEARELMPAPRALRGESMGLIAPEAWAGSFPQIPAGELETELEYRPDGSISVSADYYRLSLSRKEFVDLTKVPEIWVRREPPEEAGQVGSLGLQ